MKTLEITTRLVTRVARQEHECSLCSGKIRKGARYFAREEYIGDYFRGVVEKEHANCLTPDI